MRGEKKQNPKWSAYEFEATNDIWKESETLLFVQKFTNVWTNKGETKKKKTYRESLKDFPENKNQPIELSAKIESISIIIVHRQKLDKTYYDNTIALRRL